MTKFALKGGEWARVLILAKIKYCSQVPGGSPSDRLDVLADGEPRDHRDLHHLGSDLGDFRSGARDTRRGKYVASDAPYSSDPAFIFLYTSCTQIRYVFQVGDSSSKNLTNRHVCRILEQYDRSFFQVFFFLMSYVLPLKLICIFYVCMLIKLWRGARISAESRRGRRRVTRLVLVVVGVFAVCWCPIQVKSSHCVC